MPYEYLECLKGKFIVAIPGLSDPNFTEAVICICEHNMSGAFGLVLNRKHPMITCREIFNNIGFQYDEDNKTIDNIPIYIGGPVHTNGIFVLHSPPFEWPECIKINKNIGLSNSREILEAIALQKGPDKFTLFLGCSGWGPSQLENEIKENIWLTCPINEDIIFSYKSNMRWEQAMMLI